MATVFIMIRKDKSVVWPPCVVVKPGEEIKFKVVGTTATVFLPRAEAFAKVSAAGLATAVEHTFPVGLQGAKIKAKDQAAAGPGLPGELGAGDSTPQIHPYAVYCRATNDFAEGNSSPVIIIEPPDPPGGLPWPGIPVDE